MTVTYQCPDCRALHDEPAEAVLGFRVRCLDCALEQAFPPAPLAAVDERLAA